MSWIVVFLCFLIVFAIADRHLTAIGPFGKLHSINDDLGHTHPCHRGSGIASSVEDEPVNISSLNVTATLYTNNQQINVSWTPVSSLCKDDFVGIYFVEALPSAGQYSPFNSFIC